MSPDGTWLDKPNSGDGRHNITVSEIDLAGNKGTAGLGFTLDTQPPVLTIALANDTGASATDGITNDPTLYGTAEPSATGIASVITISTAGGTLGSAYVGPDGTWSFKPLLKNGAYDLTASESDLAGNTGGAPVSIVLDTAAPPVTFDSILPTSVAGAFELSGTAEPPGVTEIGSVVINDGTQVLGSTQVGTDGTWAFVAMLDPGLISSRRPRTTSPAIVAVPVPSLVVLGSTVTMPAGSSTVISPSYSG